MSCIVFAPLKLRLDLLVIQANEVQHELAWVQNILDRLGLKYKVLERLPFLTESEYFVGKMKM